MQKRLLITVLAWIILFYWGISAQNRISVPHNFSKAVESIEHNLLGSEKGKSSVKAIDRNALQVKLTFILDQLLRQDEWQLTLQPAFIVNGAVAEAYNHIVDHFPEIGKIR